MPFGVSALWCVHTEEVLFCGIGRQEAEEDITGLQICPTDVRADDLIGPVSTLNEGEPVQTLGSAAVWKGFSLLSIKTPSILLHQCSRARQCVCACVRVLAAPTFPMAVTG